VSESPDFITRSVMSTLLGLDLVRTHANPEAEKQKKAELQFRTPKEGKIKTKESGTTVPHSKGETEKQDTLYASSGLRTRVASFSITCV